MNQALYSIGAIVAAVIGLAIVAVLVSKNSQTSTVISSASSGLSSIITSAVSPVTQGNSLLGSTGNYLQ